MWDPRAANSVSTLSPPGRGWGCAGSDSSRDYNPSPHPSPYGRGSRTKFADGFPAYRSAPTIGYESHDRSRSAARRLRPHRRILHPPRHRAGRPARQREDRQGRDRGDRRRVRLRQIGHLLRGDAHPRSRRPHRRRRGALHRPRYPRRQRGSDAQPAWARNVDDLPEPARGAQSHPQGRPSDRGRAGAAFAGGFLRPHGQGDRDPRPGAHRPPARALPCLSVRALRRHVPACGDRAGARLPPATPHRRRADHRARRDHAEDGHGPHRRAHQAARHVDHPHHPRSRARRDLLRPRGGDGEGPRGGVRALA